jgi:hypothetical protein
MLKYVATAAMGSAGARMQDQVLEVVEDDCEPDRPMMG